MRSKPFCLVLLLAVSAAVPAGAQTFQEALASAYQNSPQLMAERARVREVDENYVQAEAQGRFTANTMASAGYTKSDTGFLSQTGVPGLPSTIVSTNSDFKPRSFAVTGQKPLYQGGRVRSLKGQAKYGVLAAREALRNTEQTILLTAATAYADVLQDEAVADIRRNNVRVLTRQENAATDRFDVGAGTRTDIAQAQSRLAQSEIGLATADANLAESRASFFRAMGYSPSQLSRIPEFALPPTLAATKRMALTYNPQLESARYNQDAAKLGIDVAKSADKPVLSLQTFAQFNENQSSTLINQDAIGLAANLTVPLLTGGANASRIRAATEVKNRSVFEVRNVEQAIEERVESIWSQLEGARRALAASQRQIDAAQIAYDGVEIEQQVGTRSALDVLNAEQEVLNAKLAYAQSERNVDILTFQLLVLSGAFDALSLNLPVETYDPRENFVEVTNIGPLTPLMDKLEATPVIGRIFTKTGQVAEELPVRAGLRDNLPAVEQLPVDPGLARTQTAGINSFPVADVSADVALPVLQGDSLTAGALLNQMKDDLQYVPHPFKRKSGAEPDTP